MSADNQDARKSEMQQEDARPVLLDAGKGGIGRRRLVVTGLTAPVVLTLGSRSAQAQSHAGSTMSSVADPAKKKKK